MQYDLFLSSDKVNIRDVAFCEALVQINFEAGSVLAYSFGRIFNFEQ